MTRTPARRWLRVLAFARPGPARCIRRDMAVVACLLGIAAAVLAGCRAADRQPATSTGPDQAVATPAHATPGPSGTPPRPSAPTARAVTLAFAGDIHFQMQLAGLLDHPRRALEPIGRALADADVAMVNLESAIAKDERTPARKELEVPSARYWFRTSPAALEVLAAAGVDVVTMANNHGADYGVSGLHDTLRAIHRAPVHVVGVGANRQAAFTPHRDTVKGTTFAFFGADASFRESASSVWSAGTQTAGLAAAHGARPRALLDAVGAASRRGEVVVVYLHWGQELRSCPTGQQRTTAGALAAAGADVVIGAGAHVLLGSGWLGTTYVAYGLGNFVWYHDHQPDTGVLRLRVADGRVVDDSFAPARIHGFGAPRPLTGAARRAAAARWRGLRACTGLEVRDRMRSSLRPGCPVPAADLRYLQMTYLGFDGAAHEGEMVVHERYARAVVTVFGRLYRARWPIEQMRLVDDYGGDDERSMAANNTSGFNCRRVASSKEWSAHAYGVAVDVNPLQNPYVTETGVQPPRAASLAAIDRSWMATVPRGVIRDGDMVVRAFANIGWDWGGQWSGPKDYQHFQATDR